MNTRNKHHFRRQNANISCSQKGTSCAVLCCAVLCCASSRRFNVLPSSLKFPNNRKVIFKAALRKYLNTHYFYCVEEMFMCKNVL